MDFGKTLRTTFVGLGIVLAAGSLPARAENPPATPAAPVTKPALSGLEQFKAMVESVKLTDEQKPKIDALFVAAKNDFTAAKDIKDAAERKAKATAIHDKLIKDVDAVLNAAQQAELKRELTPHATFPQQIDKIKQKLHAPELKLTDDQLKEADAILNDALKKMEDVLADARKNGKDANATDVRAQKLEVSKEMQAKLMKLLNADQQAALAAPKK